jgi:hypothetical protein
LWLQKRKYERLQGQIMASDSAETADISKGGAALAARSGAGGIMDARADVEDVGGGMNQKLSQPPMGVLRVRVQLPRRTPCAWRTCQPV